MVSSDRYRLADYGGDLNERLRQRLDFPAVPVRLCTARRQPSTAWPGLDWRIGITPPGLTVSGLAAAEQRQDDLRRLIGDRQRLRPYLLLHLKSLKPGAFLGQIGVNQ